MAGLSGGAGTICRLEALFYIKIDSFFYTKLYEINVS